MVEVGASSLSLLSDTKKELFNLCQICTAQTNPYRLLKERPSTGAHTSVSISERQENLHIPRDSDAVTYTNSRFQNRYDFTTLVS